MFEDSGTATYLLIEDAVTADGKKVHTYGIAVMPKPSHEFHDLATDREAVARLVSRCNELRLDPIHLPEVIEDFILTV